MPPKVMAKEELPAKEKGPRFITWTSSKGYKELPQEFIHDFGFGVMGPRELKDCLVLDVQSHNGKVFHIEITAGLEDVRIRTWQREVKSSRELDNYLKLDDITSASGTEDKPCDLNLAESAVMKRLGGE